MTPHGSAASTLIPLILAVTVCYGIWCWILPFRACRTCAGTGRHHTRLRRAARLCRRCKGTGLRLRAGRWIANQIIHLYREGTR